MKYALMISAALLMAVNYGQPASAQSPTDLVKQAVDALGGADALRAVKTLVLKADAKHWEPGQSNSVNGESRFLGDSTMTASVDYANKDGVSVRFDWDRDMKYPAEADAYAVFGRVVDTGRHRRIAEEARLAVDAVGLAGFPMLGVGL